MGGLTRNRLAAVEATTGAVDTSWNPNANNTVHALALSSDGSRLYAGGAFTKVGGLTRNRLAAINTSTGAVEKKWDPWTNSTVRTLAVSGNRLYAGGDFTTMKGQSRTRLVLIDGTTGDLDSSWGPTADNSVRTMTLSKDGTRVYVGGFYIQISRSRSYRRLARLDANTDAPNSSWPPNPGYPIYALAVSDTRVYAGGGGIGGNLTAFDAKANLSTGTLDSQWAPTVFDADPNNLGTFAITGESGPRLYVGGDWIKIAERVQQGFAQFSDPDASAPTVSGVTPEDGAREARVTANFDATFSEAVDPSTLSTSSFTLTKEGSPTPVEATVSYDETTKKATLNPSVDLDKDATYAATSKGETSGAKDVVGNALAADKIWSFTTPDTTSPETTINSGPSGTVNSDSASFEFSSSESGSSFECSLDGGAFSSCTSPEDYTNLSDGEHIFEVQAIDAAGNVDATPARQIWTIDATAPIVQSPQHGLTPWSPLGSKTVPVNLIWSATDRPERHIPVSAAAEHQRPCLR